MKHKMKNNHLTLLCKNSSKLSSSKKPNSKILSPCTLHFRKAFDNVSP